MTGDGDPHSEQLDEIIAAYLQAVEAGTVPSREELLAQYPELADRLRQFLDQHDESQRPKEADDIHVGQHFWFIGAKARRSGKQLPPMAVVAPHNDAQFDSKAGVNDQNRQPDWLIVDQWQRQQDENGDDANA